MQINGIGNNQIGNSYQNPNRMPNSTTGKKEDEDVSKRLEAMGVKVELSFRQAQPNEQEVAKEPVEAEKVQESFSVLGWIKKIWDAGMAWLKSIWNDEQVQEPLEAEAMEAEAMEAEPETDDVLSADAEAEGAELFEADATPDKFRTAGTPLHISGMQDSYNRYGQPSKLGVEPVNNMTVRK